MQKNKNKKKKNREKIFVSDLIASENMSINLSNHLFGSP